MPRESDRRDVPSTLKRSPRKARETWEKTHDAAVGEYGEGERAHRTAFASLKHSFEKVGDHWEAKDHRAPPTRRPERTPGTAPNGPVRPTAALTSRAGPRKNCCNAPASSASRAVPP